MISLTTKQINALKIVFPQGRVSLIEDQGRNDGKIELIKGFSSDGYNNCLHYFNDEILSLTSEHMTSTNYPTKRYSFTKKEKEALSALKKGTFCHVIHEYNEDAVCEMFQFENEDLHAIKCQSNFLDFSFTTEYTEIYEG